MLSILLLGAATCTTLFLLILWIDSIASNTDEFSSVKEWHNFQTAMKEKK